MTSLSYIDSVSLVGEKVFSTVYLFLKVTFNVFKILAVSMTLSWMKQYHEMLTIHLLSQWGEFYSFLFCSPHCGNCRE